MNEITNALYAEIDRLKAENKKLTIKTSNSLANNLCPDHRDKQAGKPCLACEIDRLKKRVGELEAALTEERQRNRVGEAVIRENEALTKENLDLFASRNEWIQKIDQLTAENARLRKALERIADYDSYHNEWPNEIWINAPPEELAKVILAGGEYPPEQALKEDSHEG